MPGLHAVTRQCPFNKQDRHNGLPAPSEHGGDETATCPTTLSQHDIEWRA